MAKPCRTCKSRDWQPQNSLQYVCSPQCALEYVRKVQGKAEKASLRAQERKERATLAQRRGELKTRSEWIKDTQREFNRYIRARDYGKPCISSGRLMSNQGVLKGQRIDAGHYRSTGAASHLRFNFLNCHAQSVHDNRELSGNTVEYRKMLILKIGEARVIELENDNAPRRFDIDWLKRARDIFRRRANWYEKRRGIK